MATVSHEDVLNVHLSAEQKNLVEEAAAMSEQAVDSFAASALVEAARRVMVAQRVIRLSDRDRDRFLELLDNPPEPGVRLKQAAEWHKENVVQ
jgi:uncharacterized protein (DUF1778 family)